TLLASGSANRNWCVRMDASLLSDALTTGTGADGDGAGLVAIAGAGVLPSFRALSAMMTKTAAAARAPSGYTETVQGRKIHGRRGARGRSGMRYGASMAAMTRSSKRASRRTGHLNSLAICSMRGSVP